MIDTAKIRLSNNLMGMITTKLTRAASTNGGEYKGPCPFCGGDDRFRVQPNAPEGPIWMCHICTGAVWKDVIDFVMRRDNKTFVDACEYLGGPKLEKSDFVPAKPFQPSMNPPPFAWQMKAAKSLALYESKLWSPQGEQALGWLRRRGLKDRTLRRARIGFSDSHTHESLNLWGLPDESDENGKQKEVHIPRGVVIPGLVRRVPWFLKVRRAEGEPKYIHAKGSRPVLYLSDTIYRRPITVLTEGEFDALLLWQEIEDQQQVGVATLGSAYNGLAVWGHYLKATRLLVAYHHDEAGEKNSAKIVRTFPNAELVEIPRLRPNNKDLTDYFRAGGNLREWIEEITHVKE